MTDIQAAIDLLKAYGYRVTKPTRLDNGRVAQRAPKKELNAIGKPYGPGFDPKYRMRYRTPSISNQQGNICGTFLSAEAWPAICAKAEVDAIRRGLVDPAKARFNPPAVVAMLVPPKPEAPAIEF